MGAGDIRAGGAYVELWADKKRLTAGLKAAADESKQWASQITALGAGLSALGAGLVAPFALSAKAFADNGSKISDFAKRTGMGVEAVSQLQYAAVQSGTEIGTLEKSIGKMSETISGAIQHEESAVLSLKKLGLTATDLRGKLPEQQLSIFADKLAAISDVNIRTDLARAIFGKGGGDLIPLLAHGSAGLDQLRERAERLGLTMSAEDAAAADAFGDSLDDLKSAGMAVANAIGGALAPALKSATDLFVSVAKPVTEFIKDNKGMITTAAAAAAGILAVGGALTTMGLGLTLAGAAIPGLMAAGGVLAAVAMSPVTWVIAAGAAVVGVVGYVTGGFSAMSRMANDLLGETTAVVQGIANAIQSGNIEAAWDIAGAAINVGWIATVNALKAVWRGFTDFIADAFTSRLSGLLNEMHAFATEFKQMTGVDIGTSLTGGMAKGFNDGAKGRQAASQAAADKDAGQLTLAKAVLQGLIDGVKPEDRLSFGKTPDIDKITAEEDAKKKKKGGGKKDDTADALTARGAIGLGGFNGWQERMAKDVNASLGELKEIKTRITGMGGKTTGMNEGAIRAAKEAGFMKPNSSALHKPVAGNMFGIALPADFKGGELAPQTPIRDNAAAKDSAIAERTAKAAETTAKETKRIADKAEQGIAYGT